MKDFKRKAINGSYKFYIDNKLNLEYADAILYLISLGFSGNESLQYLKELPCMNER